MPPRATPPRRPRLADRLVTATRTDPAGGPRAGPPRRLRRLATDHHDPACGPRCATGSAPEQLRPKSLASSRRLRRTLGLESSHAERGGVDAAPGSAGWRDRRKVTTNPARQATPSPTPSRPAPLRHGVRGEHRGAEQHERGVRRDHVHHVQAIRSTAHEHRTHPAAPSSTYRSAPTAPPSAGTRGARSWPARRAPSTAPIAAATAPATRVHEHREPRDAGRRDEHRRQHQRWIHSRRFRSAWINGSVRLLVREPPPHCPGEEHHEPRHREPAHHSLAAPPPDPPPCFPSKCFSFTSL